MGDTELLTGQEADGASHIDATGVQSWKVEVIADSTGKWVGNAMRYPTREVAVEAGSDLFGRWTAVRQWRVTATSDAANK